MPPALPVADPMICSKGSNYCTVPGTQGRSVGQMVWWGTSIGGHIQSKLKYTWRQQMLDFLIAKNTIYITKI